MRRVYNETPPVHFAAAGFYATDVARFEKMVGPEKADRFRQQKDDLLKRSKRGALTQYERSLEKTKND